jgi:uncharacterized protein YggT (Ycf19 family)
MEENKVDSGNDSRRAQEHQVVRSRVEREVYADIAHRAGVGTTAEAEEMNRVAGQLRGKALHELEGTGHDVRRERILARIAQVIDYAFYVVYSLLGIRLVLALIGARSSAGFVRFIQAVTDPFYAMFRGIVASPEAGGFTLALPIVIAMVVYGLLQLGITRLLRLVAHRRTEV